MNPDLFKSSPEPARSAAPVVAVASAAVAVAAAPVPVPVLKTNRAKCEQGKVELPQVLMDSKSGRSYSKGKLLGKVLQSGFYWGFLIKHSNIL